VIRLIVLRAVDLDDKVPFMTGEVSKVRTDGGLPPEVRVLDWQTSQMPPEFTFGVGHITTQFACSWDACIELIGFLT